MKQKYRFSVTRRIFSPEQEPNVAFGDELSDAVVQLTGMETATYIGPVPGPGEVVEGCVRAKWSKVGYVDIPVLVHAASDADGHVA